MKRLFVTLLLLAVPVFALANGIPKNPPAAHPHPPVKITLPGKMPVPTPAAARPRTIGTDGRVRP